MLVSYFNCTALQAFSEGVQVLEYLLRPNLRWQAFLSSVWMDEKVGIVFLVEEWDIFSYFHSLAKRFKKGQKTTSKAKK